MKYEEKDALYLGLALIVSGFLTFIVIAHYACN